MSSILFTVLRQWTAEKASELIEDGLIVILDDSTEFSAVPVLALELENRTSIGRLTLQESGATELGIADKGSGDVRRGECSIFTEEQLESAIEQLLEWMGEEAGRPSGRVALTCPDQKAPFVSRAEAQTIKKRAGLPGSVVAYRCTHCGHWHLGTKKGRVSVARRTFRS